MANINIYERNELYWGEESQQALFKKHVIVFGIGGVGSFAIDALARSGVGKLTIVDFDKVAPSNINRQLIASHSSIGKLKTEIMKDRIKDINPNIEVVEVSDFYTTNLNSILDSNKVDYVIDAIDTLKYKIDLIVSCKELNIPIISSMGAGNRIDPTKLYIADISEVKASNRPFLKNVKYKLKVAGITQGLTVVTSSESPRSVEKISTIENIATKDGKEIEVFKLTPASVPFVPPVAGYFLASHVVKELIYLQ